MSLVDDSSASPSGEGFSAVAWSKSEPFGADFANARLARDRLSAEGVAISGALLRYRLECTLETVFSEASGGSSEFVVTGPTSTSSI
jgi:hypothetical protein